MAGAKRNITVKKTTLRGSGDDPPGKTPQESLGMMWRLALDAWSFKENIGAEPGLQRDVVVLKKRGR